MTTYTIRGPRRPVRREVKVLHILCAIVGFGGVTLNGVYGVYGVQAKRRGGLGAVAIGESVYRVSTMAEYFIYAVFVLGIALAWIGDNIFDFGPTWLWLSMLLFAIGIGLSHGVLRPRVRRLNALTSELGAAGGPPAGATGPPPQAVGWKRSASRSG